jgi:hypothetical protein
MKTKTLILVGMMSLAGCVGNREISKDDQKRKIHFGVEAGANKGGIVENTDMSYINGASVDAFSGATRIGGHVGGHATLPVGRNDVQVGMDYMYSPQTFTYDDDVNGYFGTRKINLSQFIMPFTYNLNLFKSSLPAGTICLKLGGALEYNLASIKDNGSHLPGYTIHPFTGGVALGISTLPVKFKDNSRMGLSFDVYKGSQIFEDLYNRKEFKMPTSSYMKLSLIYQFK